MADDPNPKGPGMDPDESLQRYESLVDLSDDTVAVHCDGILVFINAAGVRLLKANGPEQLLGRPVMDIVPPESRPKHLEILSRLAQGQPVPSIEDKIICLDGSTVDVQLSGTAIVYQGKPAFQIIARDISERKRSEEALRESEERFRAIVEQNSEGILLMDEEGRVIEWNAAMERITGIGQSEVIGQFVWDLQYRILPPEKKTPAYYEAMKNRLHELLKSGQTVAFSRPHETVIRTPDGRDVSIQQTAFPIKTARGYRIGSLFRDISERKRSEQELDRRVAELEALHAVARAVTESTNLDELVARIVQIVSDRLLTDIIAIGFLDPKAEALVFHPFARNGVGKHGPAVKVDTGIIGWVARNQAPYRVGDVRSDPYYLEADPAISSELCVPITAWDKLIGVINVESPRPDAFTPEDERLLMAIAGEVGNAVEKIRLFEEERTRRKELETLAEISAVVRRAETREEMLPAILEHVMDIFAAQGAAIAFRDPKDGALVIQMGSGSWEPIQGIRVPPGEGVGGFVAETKEIYISKQARQDPRMFRKDFIGAVDSLLCLPLMVESETVAVLYIGRSSAFTDSDMHLAKAMSDIAAGAIHRVQLRTKTLQQLDRLTALRMIDQSILSSHDLEQTLAVLLQKIKELLHVDGANFLLYKPSSQILVTAAELGLPADPIWDASLVLAETHAGRAVLEKKIEFIPDLREYDDILTRRINQRGESYISYAAVPLVAKDEVKGILQLFSRTRLDPTPDWLDFLDALSGQAAIAIDNAQLFITQEATNARLLKAYDDMIDGWSRALDLRDKETEGHSIRVTELTMKLARYLGVQEEEMPHIWRGARLHDIGKMGIPDSILHKPGPLTDEEWAIMRKHPIYALDFLFTIEFLQPALEIPSCHHEKWDGSGYPQGLKGEEIPLTARIFAVVDVWDALTSDRPYRKAWTEEEALGYIRSQAGKHFDPRIVNAFFDLLADQRGNFQL